MKSDDEIKKEKDKKQAGCITALIIILLIVVCWFVFMPGDTPVYTVRLAKIGTNNNANIEIVIPSDIKDSQMMDIAKKEAKKYTSQRYVFVFFYTKDKHDCFATSHSNDSFAVKRLLQYR